MMKKIFEQSIDALVNYINTNNIKSLILGISGGIDSTVCAAICHEAAKQTGIPLIGRSLPTKHNKEGETTAANLVGKAFCDNYKVASINLPYNSLLSFIGTMEDSMLDLSGNTLYDIQGEFPKQQTNIANGNIQARLRMIYLYNLASIHKGMVIDTDNLTEHYLGYWTLHGDVGDYKPIGNLWKTEVFGLAEWLKNWYGSYTHTYFYTDSPEEIKYKQDNLYKARAIRDSLKLKPTAGLGITDSDLEEIGAESYEQVDKIIREILAWKRLAKSREDLPISTQEQREMFLDEQQMLDTPIHVIINVATKHFNSEFKRK